ncbi:hypothetical protein CsSME_00030561 [Camellia sinensis var. sinensis]
MLTIIWACQYFPGDAIETCCSLWTSSPLNHLSTSSHWSRSSCREETRMLQSVFYPSAEDQKNSSGVYKARWSTGEMCSRTKSSSSKLMTPIIHHCH